MSSVRGNPLYKTDAHSHDTLEFCVQHDLMTMNDATSEVTMQSVSGDCKTDLALLF